MLNKFYLFIILLLFQFKIIGNNNKIIPIKNDKLYKTIRVLMSGGVILEPTVLINSQYLFKNDNSSIFGGFKIGIDNINSIFKNKRVGFVNKNKLFFSKLMDIDLYRRPKLKDDFFSYIFGIQIEVGLSIILNKCHKKIEFNDKNKINTHLNSLNILVGFKEEIGKIGEILKASKIFPTKLTVDLMYILDLKQGFSFYISILFFQCFSPVYLFSCNKEDLSNTFNNNNYFNWNINIEIGFIGLNFFI